MSMKSLSTGILHPIPADIRKALLSVEKVRLTWEDITPIARNEWICWITSAKKVETRAHRIERALDMLAHGKKRPCCWEGCSHR
jgi:uncharacterized protein YdeI (YjbR/CyaY-like superfamily)